jgi:hypothetical protein
MNFITKNNLKLHLEKMLGKVKIFTNIKEVKKLH